MNFIGIGLTSFAMLGAAVGIGLIFGNAVQGVSRNPSAEPKIFKLAIIGAALAELMGLLGFVIAMLLQ